jgi:site-specific DNA-methyltransferase (adenine-specific)
MSIFHDKLPNPVQKIGEYQIVKTPVVLVNRMLDGYPAEIYQDKTKKWLVPVSKSGVFELGIYVRLMRGLATAIPNSDERRVWIVKEMIYSFVPTTACELFVRRNYLGKVWNNIIDFEKLEGNVRVANFLKVRANKNGEVMVKKDEVGKETYVKFDCIVGNPPYQDNSKANDPKNIYPDFVIKAMNCNPKYMSMVIPARWMMGSGKGIQVFLDKMLGSKKLSKIVVEQDSSKWFPDVSIKGGAMFFLYDRDHNSYISSINNIDMNLEGEDCIITDPIGLSVKAKVLAKCSKTFDKVMLGSCPFEIRSSHKDWVDTNNNAYICHNSGKGASSKTTFISKSLIKKNVEFVDKYKMCCACGFGSDGIPMPFVISPGHVVSQSYLVMSYSDSEDECNNAALFFKTHLAQYLISLLKNTQNVAKRVFKYLPYLDFSRSYTDNDLYTMFDLSQEEINHIEKTTKDFPIFRSAKKNATTKVSNIEIAAAKFEEMQQAASL